MVCEKIRAGLLQEILPGLSGPDVKIHAVWPHRGQLSLRLRYVVDQLVLYAGQGRLD